MISDLDHNNPVVVCDLHQTQQVVKTCDGARSPQTTATTWTYDSFGRGTRESTTTNGGTPSQVVKNTSYVWDDAVTATTTSASGTYFIDMVAFSDTEDASGNRPACSSTSDDGQSYSTGQTSGLTGGLKTTSTEDANYGTAANGYTPGDPSTATTKYDAFGDVIATDDPDANASISGHIGCTVSATAYTTCTGHESTFHVFPTSTGNALNQTSRISYANTTSLFGYGIWPESPTDANSQTTTYTYDALGRTTGDALPDETSGDQTKQWVYTTWCSGTAAQAPCEEIDRLDSSTTTTTRAFSDGEGRLVETRAPGPVGQDVVMFAYFDTSGRQIFKSNPYFITAYTGAPGRQPTRSRIVYSRAPVPVIPTCSPTA